MAETQRDVPLSDEFTGSGTGQARSAEPAAAAVARMLANPRRIRRS